MYEESLELTAHYKQLVH